MLLPNSHDVAHLLHHLALNILIRFLSVDLIECALLTNMSLALKLEEFSRLSTRTNIVCHALLLTLLT